MRATSTGLAGNLEMMAVARIGRGTTGSAGAHGGDGLGAVVGGVRSRNGVAGVVENGICVCGYGDCVDCVYCIFVCLRAVNMCVGCGCREL
jgi:hypothetical protein